jgi:polysaccharide pyruvyl transferase WcaK-like protein
MTSRHRFLLAGNGGQYNRGCQAIERGTIEIVCRALPASEFTSAPFGSRWHGDVPVPVETRLYPERGWDDFRGAAILARKAAFVAAPLERWHLYSSRTRYLDGSWPDLSAMLCLGGDNYSLDYGRPDAFVALDRRALARGVPVVLWGASVGPFSAHRPYERFMTEHLKQLTAIFVREDDTREYLASVGVSDNVYRVADPAFVMPALPTDERTLGCEIDEGCVGINLSPLLARYLGLSHSRWVALAGEIIAQVADSVPGPVVLVPHVVFPPYNDDGAFMHEAAASAGLHGIRSLSPTLTAPQIKWAISRMGCLIGARTHATIAAMSSATPCASIAYSAKAFGINRDVYGHTEWALGLRELTPEKVATLAEALLAEGDSVRATLVARMPRITEMAYAAGTRLAELLDG